MLDLDWANISLEDVSSWNRSLFETYPTVECDQWVFNHEQYENTFTSEWSAVCGSSWLRPVFTNICLAGLLVGCIVTGKLSDRFGRKRILVLSGMSNLLLGLACTFNPELISYLILRFFFNISVRGIELISVVLLTESLSDKWTGFAGIFIMCLYTLGGFVIAGLGYAITDHRWLHMSLLVIGLVVMSYQFFIHESPKWLIANGRFEELDKSMRAIAKFNRKEYPEELAKKVFTELAERRTEEKTDKKPKISLIWLLKPEQRKVTFMVLMGWITQNVVNAALTVSMNELAGSIYLNIVISSAMDIPVYPVGLLIVHYFSRKVHLIGAFGIVCIVNVVTIPLLILAVSQETVTYLSLACRAIVNNIYGTLYIFGALLLPIEIRQIALGTYIAIGASFALASPYIAGPLASLWPPLPNVVYGSLGFLAAVCTFFLPNPKKVEDDTETECDGISSDGGTDALTSSTYGTAAGPVVPPECFRPISKHSDPEVMVFDSSLKNGIVGTSISFTNSVDTPDIGDMEKQIHADGCDNMGFDAGNHI